MLAQGVDGALEDVYAFEDGLALDLLGLVEIKVNTEEHRSRPCACLVGQFDRCVTQSNA